MAPRKKKDSQPSEEASCVEQWPNLPQQLINFIGRQTHLNLIQNVSSAGVIKSWKLGTNRCVPNSKPPVLELHHNHQHCDNNHLYNLCISFYQGCYHWWGCRKNWPPERYWEQLNGCSHGWILTDCYLLDPTDPFGGGWSLPSWDAQVPIQRAALSSSLMYRKGCSVMAVTGCSSPAFRVSRIECLKTKRSFYFQIEKEWSEQESTLIDPNDSEGKLMKFTNVVGCNGKFYALTLQGTLAVIEEEEIDSQFQITKLCRRRAVPSLPSRHFTEYLLESSGEILLIFLICKRSIISVDHVEVFKLIHLGELSWIKLETLGDRTLFAGINSCISVTASQVGCRSNSIYFTHRSIDAWMIYDMETGCILPCYDSTGSELKAPVWKEPVDGQ